MKLFFINTDAVSNSEQSYHDEWIRRSVVVTSSRDPRYRDGLEKIKTGDKVLVYANQIGVVAIGTVLDDDILDVTGDMTISPKESIEYHKRVSWDLDLRPNPITRDALIKILGQGPVQAVQQIQKERKEFMLREIAALQFKPSANFNEYIQQASEIQRLGIFTKPSGTKIPQRADNHSLAFYRNPKVRAWTLQRANGFCEMCMQVSPFLDDKGEPYLESHHIVPLASGGPDIPDNTAALCPNCHRELHFGIERKNLSQVLLAAIQSKND